MRTITIITLASLTSLGALGGCSGDKRSSLPSSPLPPTTRATRNTAPGPSATAVPGSLATKLLSPADVPGSTPSPASSGSADLSACFPGNPLGAKADPSQVTGPDLSVTDASAVEHQYGSSARQATPEQVTAFLSAFASPAGSACALNAYKAAITDNPKPPKFDASGLTGPVTVVAVGDGGVVLALSGDLVTDGNTVPALFDLLLFRKGSLLVSLSASTLGGPAVPGQAVELGSKIAARL